MSCANNGRTSDEIWLAGWLEGEGCFHHGRRTDGRPRFVVEALSIDLDVLERVAAIAGVGKIRQRNVPGKASWSWRIDRRSDALEFAARMQPLMGIRRRAAIQEMLDLAVAEPPVANDPAERSERMRKAWVTRRRKALAA